MQVYRHKPPYEPIEPLPYHLLLKKGWEPSHIPGKQQFAVVGYCGNKHVITKGDAYENLSKAKHKDKLCVECIKEFKKSRDND